MGEFNLANFLVALGGFIGAIVTGVITARRYSLDRDNIQGDTISDLLTQVDHYRRKTNAWMRGWRKIARQFRELKLEPVWHPEDEDLL